MVQSFAFAEYFYTLAGFDRTTRKEFSMKMLFQYSDNSERKRKLRIVQLLRQ